jgi:hypothetical protein
MLPCISQVCSLGSSFEDDIDGYADAAGSSIELWLTKLEEYLVSHTTADVRSRAHGRLWMEISPTPSGIPAAASQLGDSAPSRWQLPDDVWCHLAPGTYLVQAVDGRGRELARFAFRRGADARGSSPSPLSPGVTALA